MNPTPPSNPEPQRPGWWGRNWKWFVPTGCLTLILLAVGFGCLIVFVVFAAMKSSDAYQTALAKAKADSRVTAALGTPIEDGLFVSGNTNVNGSSGNADMSVPISGPKGKGTIYFVASKFGGRWTYSKLVVEVGTTGQKIDLIGDADESAP